MHKKNASLTVQIIFKENDIVANNIYCFKLTYYDENMKLYGLNSEILLK